MTFNDSDITKGFLSLNYIDDWFLGILKTTWELHRSMEIL